MEIYKITNLINNKIYIGKDTSSNPNYFGSGILIKRAIHKYGKENFIKEIIDITNDYNVLSEKEIYWISHYKSTDSKIGYNITLGGDGGDTLSNHPDLELIKEKISKNSYTEGKTYEEAFGKEKASEYRGKLSNSNAKHNLGKKYEEIYSQEKSEIIKNTISENTKNSWNYERSKKQSKLAKENIHKSLLSDKSIVKNREYLNERWSDWRKNEISIIEKSNIDELIEYLKKIPNTLFNDRKDFYEYIGDDKKHLIKKELIRRKKPHKNNEDNKKKVIVGGKIYNSITEASSVEGIQRSLIRYRLKSKKYTNYFYIPDVDTELKYDEIMELPFKEIKKNDNISIRVFDSETKPELLMWHRDKEDRIISSMQPTDWKFQLDNELPITITGDIFIPKGVYHRLIKGTGDLNILLTIIE